MKKYFFILLIIMLVGCSSTKGSEYETEITDISSTYPDLSFEELSNFSEIVVEGKFKGYNKPFKVIPNNNGDGMVFKDATFEIVNIFKGDYKSGENIKVRTIGGEFTDEENNLITVTNNLDEIKFTGKNTYLIFLSYPFSNNFKTDEDYYQTVTGPYGIYEKSGDNEFSRDNKTITVQELSMIDTSVNPRELEKNQMLDNLNNNLITEEEYK